MGYGVDNVGTPIGNHKRGVVMEQSQAKIGGFKQRAADWETMRYPEAYKEDAKDVVS